MALSNDWKVEKARILSLTNEERIKEAKKSIPFEDIIPWPLYFKAKKSEILALNDGPVQSVKGNDLASKVSMFAGDITQLPIDAIVNAANEKLLGGGGVDGAIHRASGGLLLEECRALNGCPTGQAKITGAYKLPAKYIIHTVGPIGEKPELLESCYRKSLELLVSNGLRTIAFPCISTGVFGYSSENACPVVLKTVRSFLELNSDKVDLVIFCLFLSKDINIYSKEMQKYFPVN